MLKLTSAEIEEVEAASHDLESTRPRAAWIVRMLLTEALTRRSRRLLTTTEAADYLGVSDQTVRNWIKRGILPTSRTLGRRRIPFVALEPVADFRRRRTAATKVRMSDEDAAAMVRAHRKESGPSTAARRS